MPKPLLACLLALALPGAARAEVVFVEAEAFDDVGGWSVDTAFTQIVGSPYLLAHGLGKPVKDAVTKIQAPKAGQYRLWARTKDWVAPWKAPGAPARFQIVVAGRALAAEFGTAGADWHWQDGGLVELPAGEVTLALRDLTGFDGRCDAILLSSDPDFVPPRGDELARARKRWLGLPEKPEDAGDFDLVVVGGGYSGLGAAISAARQSLKVALVQDRMVLGGNGSSEVRVWAQGGTLRGKYPRLGEIVEEFADHAPDSPAAAEHFGDEHKEKIVRAEKNISLFLGHFVYAVEMAPPGEGGSKAEGGSRADAANSPQPAADAYDRPAIRSVIALETRTGRERAFRGKYFADCTGHGVVGALAGAKYHVEPKGRMGMSNMWYWRLESTQQAWPATPWALPLETSDFPKTVGSKSKIDGQPFNKGEWFWESGFDKDPLRDLELIRDWNLRAVFGAFSAIKRETANANAALQWVAFVGGPRESRLLEGDVVLTREDIVSGRAYPDGCVPTTWDIDLHYPKEQFAKKFPDNPFISRAEFGAGVDRKNGYPVPYRCFYSKNVPNLFMAGRCISVNHEALGTVRVMRTCGMMGEVVGKAAYVAVTRDATPRGVYQHHLPELLELLGTPGAMRRETLAGPLVRDENIGKVSGYFSKATDRVTGVVEPSAKVVPLSALAGLVVDDNQAELTGGWTEGQGLSPFVGEGYRYAGAGQAAEARFTLRVAKAGKYELRLAWTPHENRSTKTACAIERPGQKPLKLRLNQRQPTTDPQGFHSLGRFDFPAGDAAVVLSTEGADGNVHADAVQLVEVKTP